MNNVCLVGFIGKKGVDLKFLQGSGKAVGTFTLNVPKTFKNGDKKEYNFMPVKCWGKSAEWLANNQDRIKKVSVEGEINTFSWDSKEGKKYGWEINGKVQVVEWNNGNKQQSIENDNEVNPIDDGDIPF